MNTQPAAIIPLITRKDLAARLSLSLRFIDNLTRDGEIPHYKIGKSVRYDSAEVEARLKKSFLTRAKP
jgi:excisionase family DNA binding protein